MSQTILPTGTALNNVREAGVYVVTNPTATGLASATYVVEVTQGVTPTGQRYTIQQAVDIATGLSYVRVQTTASWGAFAEAGASMTGADIVAALDTELGSDGWQGGGGNELSATLQVYVDGGAGNDANDGLTALTAKATIQAAFNLLAAYDVNPLGAIHGAGGQFAQINIEGGTYDEEIIVPRFKNRMSIDVLVNGAGTATIAPSTAPTYAMTVQDSNCTLTIGADVEFTNAQGLAVIGPTSRVYCSAGVKFTNCTVYDVYVESGHYTEHSPVITGDKAVHIFTEEDPFVWLLGTPTLVDTPAFSLGYIYVGGLVVSQYSAVTGASTGPQFYHPGRGLLSLPGGATRTGGLIDQLPGDAPGKYVASEVFPPHLAAVVSRLTVTDADYNMVDTRHGAIIEMTSADAHVVNVPLQATTPINTNGKWHFVQMGAGSVTFVPEGGVTIRSLAGNLVLAGQYANATIWKRDTNEWVLVGDLIA